MTKRPKPGRRRPPPGEAGGWSMVTRRQGDVLDDTALAAIRETVRGILDEDWAVVRAELEWIARKYRVLRRAVDKGPTRAEVAKRLDVLRAAAEKLREFCAQCDDRTRLVFDDAAEIARYRYSLNTIEPARSLEEIAHGASVVASIAAKQMRDKTRPQSRIEARRVTMADLADLYAKIPGGKFKSDFQGREPITPAAQFVCRFFDAADPDLGRAALRRYMQEEITRRGAAIVSPKNLTRRVR
jgi:hypothetical protein